MHFNQINDLFFSMQDQKNLGFIYLFQAIFIPKAFTFRLFQTQFKNYYIIFSYEKIISIFNKKYPSFLSLKRTIR